MLTRPLVPTKLFTNPENPDFFLEVALFGSFPSSEYLFGLKTWFSATRGGAVSDLSMPGKVAMDGNAGLMLRVSGLVCDKGGGGGRRKEFWKPEAFVESN